MELYIRSISQLLPGKKRTFKRINDLFSYLIKRLRPMNNSEFNSTPIGKELNNKFIKSLELFKNKQIKIVEKEENSNPKIKNSFYKFKYVNKISKKTQNLKEREYLVNPSIHTCNCKYFTIVCRTCKHLFSVYLYIMNRDRLYFSQEDNRKPEKIISNVINYLYFGITDTEKRCLLMGNINQTKMQSINQTNELITILRENPTVVKDLNVEDVNIID